MQWWLEAPAVASESEWSFSLPLGVYPVVDAIATLTLNKQVPSFDNEGQERLWTFYESTWVTMFLWVIQKETRFRTAQEWPFNTKMSQQYKTRGDGLFVELEMAKELLDLLPAGKCMYPNAFQWWFHTTAELYDEYLQKHHLTEPFGVSKWETLIGQQIKLIRDCSNPYKGEQRLLPEHYNLCEAARTLVKRYRRAPSKYSQLSRLNNLWNNYYADFKTLKVEHKEFDQHEMFVKGRRIVFRNNGRREQTVYPAPKPQKKFRSGRGRKPKK